MNPQSDSITERFAWVDHWVNEDDDLNGWRIPVLRAVAYHAGTGRVFGTARICTMSNGALAFECGCGPRQVRRCLEYLEDSGYVLRGPSGGKRKWIVLRGHEWFEDSQDCTQVQDSQTANVDSQTANVDSQTANVDCESHKHKENAKQNEKGTKGPGAVPSHGLSLWVNKT